MPVDRTYLPNPLDPEVLREDWIDHPGLTDIQRAALQALSDDKLAEVLALAFRGYEDMFLFVLDNTRSDATSALLRQLDVGEDA